MADERWWDSAPLAETNKWWESAPLAEPASPSPPPQQPFTGAISGSPFEPLTQPYSEYQQRVPPSPIEGIPITPRSTILQDIERLNAEELRGLETIYPSVAIPTEVPGTELPKTPIQLPRFTADERASALAKAGVGIYNVAAGLAEFPLNPEGAAVTAATAGAGTAGGLAARGAGLLWGAYGVKETPRLFKEAVTALREGNVQQKTESLAALGLNTLIGAGGIAGTLAPRTTEALAETPTKSVETEAALGGQPIREVIAAPTERTLMMEPSLIGQVRVGEVLPEAPKVPETPPVVPKPLRAPENAPTGVPTALNPPLVDYNEALAQKVADPNAGRLDPIELSVVSSMTPTEHQRFLDRVAELRAAKSDATVPQQAPAGIPEQPVKAAEAVPSIEESARDRIREAPSYGALFEAVRRFNQSLYGKERAEEGMKKYEAEPEDLLSAHSGVMNAKSQRAKTLQALADKVFAETGLPRKEPGKFRGMNYRIDWESLREKQTTPTAEVPPEQERGVREVPQAPTQQAQPKLGQPVAEPAISFPGIGSLREADATPMRLGQIRKSEPELWKAITQHFGVDTPAQIAKLAKARFGEMAKRPDQPQGPKWTTATEEPPLGQALYGPFGIPSPTATFRAVVDLAKAAAPKIKEAYGAVKEIGDEIIRAGKMTDYRRSVLNWSAKLQRSFGESAAAQKEIQQKVPDAARREGITNWIQAGGDPNVLAQRAAATTDPKLKAGYDAALNLTPNELAVANDVKTAYDALGKRGQTYGVLSNFRDNYVTQVWNLNKGPAVGSSRTLKDKFRYSKARTFESFFEGEQAGYTPKTKDIAKLLPVYMHEMNSVIAARQLVEQMGKGVASDGRPLVAPRGVGVQVEGPQGQATLIIPKVPKGDRLDYRILENQPALSDWVWRTEDSAGNPVFEKADLALHPEAYDRLKNVLGRSAIREWYNSKTSAIAEIPKAIVKGLDVLQSETKRTMLGFFAPFHQVQEATHAIGHRVNPLFSIPKIDLVGDAPQMDAARHGLMLLPDRVSESQFMEGFKTSGLVSRIPGIGPLADWYSNYLFKEYIPGLKFKTYEAILERNNRVYDKQLVSGEVQPEDIKALSAEQANAAYGHLNYADLARNPTIQHFAQIGLLAPDFLEARARFAAQAAKGAIGTKVGREQVLALATLAIAQAAAAWIAAKTTGGNWDEKHPFEFTHGSRKYTMRSVPEDISGLISNWRTFLQSRLSPIVGKGALQYLSGVDYAGRKVSASQTTKELATAPIPLTLRTLPSVRRLTGMDRPGQIASWEQLAGAMGLRISRAYPSQKLSELHAKFLENNPSKEVREDYARYLASTQAVPKYAGVYSALQDRDADALQKAIGDLRASGVQLSKIRKAIEQQIRPTTTGTESEPPHRKNLFHESTKIERQFRNSLTPQQRKLYNDAIAERQAQWRFFRRYF